MAKPEMKPEKAAVTGLDIRIAISVVICCLTATILNSLNLKFTFSTYSLEIIQKMTASISCLLCCQDNLPSSKGSGKNRLIITAIGGGVGILVTVIDTAVNHPYLMVAMVGIGIVLTLFLCKAAKVPYINARIGGVTFILVTCTLAGHARVLYAIFRLISTFYGVLVVMLVTWIYGLVIKER